MGLGRQVYLNEEGKRRPIGLLEARLAEEATHPLGFGKTYGELLEVQAHRLKKAILGKEACTSQYLRIH